MWARCQHNCTGSKHRASDYAIVVETREGRNKSVSLTFTGELCNMLEMSHHCETFILLLTSKDF